MPSGQAVSTDDSSYCLLALNALADAWLTEPDYAYTTALVSASLPAATTSLTIGPAMAFNTPRAVRLESGCYVTVGGVDYPLEIVTQAEYNAIPLKTISAWPTICYYDGAAPTGNVFFWPVGACTVKLNVLTQLSQFASLATVVNLPPGYERMFRLTLMEEVAGAYGRQLTPLQARNAAQSRRFVKRLNSSVPQLSQYDPIVGIPPIY